MKKKESICMPFSKNAIMIFSGDENYNNVIVKKWNNHNCDF